MPIAEASVSGTVRVIAVLVLLWLLLSWLRRRSNTHRSYGPKSHEPMRPKGDVRIERPGDPPTNGQTRGGHITDADFEEVN
jgi:hypothetical protein